MQSCCFAYLKTYDIFVTFAFIAAWRDLSQPRRQQQWRTVSNFRKRKRKSLSCVCVVHKTWKWVSRRNGTVTAKRCTKSAVHEQSWKQLLFFYILYTFSILLQNGEEIGMKKDRLFLFDETVVPASLTQLREVTSTITTQIVIFHFKNFTFALVK